MKFMLPSAFYIRIAQVSLMKMQRWKYCLELSNKLFCCDENILISVIKNEQTATQHEPRNGK